MSLPTQRDIVRNASALILSALRTLHYTATRREYLDASCGALYNVADYVLGLATCAYTTDNFYRTHAGRARVWRDALHVRTCVACGTDVRDEHAVLLSMSYGAVVVCEMCALEFPEHCELCTLCGLINPRADMTEYVSVWYRGPLDEALPMSRACVSCIVAWPNAIGPYYAGIPRPNAT